MKTKMTALLILALMMPTLVSSGGFGQEEIRRRSSGPRRQLATIVFAGLGGAVLGLSTLSFYGRPQDQLSNIAIGFAVGIIAGTTYVTVRSATSRDYYDEKPPQTLSDFLRPGTITTGSDFGAGDVIEEPKVVYGPLVTRMNSENLSYGGMVGLRF